MTLGDYKHLLAFDDFCELLLPLGALNSPAELHGLLCGKLCGGADLTVDQWHQAAWDLLDLAEPPSPDVHEQVDCLLGITQQQLDSGDFGLQLFLPDDDSDLDLRTEALSQWCHGFLTGFGSAGIDPNQTFPAEQADALRDLAAIVQVGVSEHHGEDDNQQEADYLELVEYIRVVAMTFYEDQSAAKNAQKSTTNKAKLH